MPDPVAQFKQGARKTWSSGRWDSISKTIAPVGPKLLDRVGIEPGMDVLDVGTGSGGTVAIPAAQRGATVTGVDLTPELFEDARARAADAGVAVEWVEGDAESLPVGDESFDRVLSTFGHMFAPRHAVAAAELARVCRPGGVIGFCAWTPTGGAADMFRTFASYLPPPPDFVELPVLWGTEDHVRELLEPHGLELELAHAAIDFEQPSVEAFVDFYERDCGPFVMAKAALGDRWPELRSAFTKMVESANVATDGSVRVPSEYLVTVARKPG